MKFKMGGVNVELFCFFLGKNTILCYRSTLKSTFSTFTPILNFIALPFQNSFSFGSSSYQKKSTGNLKLRGKKTALIGKCWV